MFNLLRSFRRSLRRSRMERLEEKIRKGSNRRAKLVQNLKAWTQEYDALRAEFNQRPDKAQEIRARAIAVKPR